MRVSELRIRPLNSLAHDVPARPGIEIFLGIIPEIVGGAMLMQQPDHFVRMRNQVGGKFQRDQAIDPRAVDFAEIDQAAGEHLRGNPIRDRRVERKGHQLGFVALREQRAPQTFRMSFRSAGGKRDLDRRDGNSHGLTSGLLRLGRELG